MFFRNSILVLLCMVLPCDVSPVGRQDRWRSHMSEESGVRCFALNVVNRFSPWSLSLCG